MSIPPLSLKLLRSFVAVAEDLHFGRAARKLGLSQPPLSQHILVLEDEIGIRLFDRTRRSVALTAAGRLLYDEARGLLAHAERVRRVLDGCRSGASGRLSLGCAPSAVFGVLPPALARLRVQHPGLEIDISEAHTATILEQVADGTLDAGLAWDHPPHPLAAQTVWRDAFVAALPAADPLARLDSLSLEDLAQEALILAPRRIAPRHFDMVIAAFASIGITPRIAHEHAPVFSQLGFVANGLGIALVPPFAAALPIPGVIYRPVAGLEPVEICLVWNGQTAPAAVAILKQSMPVL
jgi:LysR family transcriptional regulator, benzoate and cis,cis-muconate-responsive activator of ben and cat genes